MSETDTERGVRIVQMEVARGRMNEAWSAFLYAEDRAHRAEAEVARLTVLELAEQVPGMTGMTFESQYEYDDEGGYFRTISCYPTFPDDYDGEPYDGWEFLDLMNGFTPAAICVLCGVPTDADAGEITIEQARERRF